MGHLRSYPRYFSLGREKMKCEGQAEKRKKDKDIIPSDSRAYFSPRKAVLVSLRLLFLKTEKEVWSPTQLQK